MGILEFCKTCMVLALHKKRSRPPGHADFCQPPSEISWTPNCVDSMNNGAVTKNRGCSGQRGQWVSFETMEGRLTAPPESSLMRHVHGPVSSLPQTGKALEDQWRKECGGSNLAELFPKDKDTEWAQRDLYCKIEKLQAFKVGPRTVAASGLEVVMPFG